MIPDKILYTDGHTVVVTDTTLQVKNNSYSLNGITKHGMFVLKPQRLPGILLFFMGATIAVLGIFSIVPSGMKSEFLFGPYTVLTTTAMIVVGALVAFIGILVIGLLKERYAVRISTAEGEKNAVVSSHKEYITQILEALNKAYNYLRLPAGKLTKYRSVSR